MTSPSRHIVFYDGDCGLCQHSVQWLLKRDRAQVLFYAPLQGETAKELLDTVGLPAGLDSIVYWVEKDGEISVSWYSSGVLQLLRELPFPWFFGRLLVYIPRCIRDSIYRFVARNRIRWFGNADACRLPTKAEQSRFLP